MCPFFINMVKNILRFLPLCVCYIEVYCNEWDPRVWPETFVEDGKPFIEFTCGAYLKSEEWLSWYRASDNRLLTTIEQQYDGYRTINLQWPLARLQNTEVYCAKENGTYLTYESGMQLRLCCLGKTTSKSIPIKFKKTIEDPTITEESRPWLTPSAFVDHGKQVIRYTCYAYLQKWNTLSWYQIKDKSVSKLAMIQQEAEYGYVKITLQKTLEPSDNGSKIYCGVEGNQLKLSEHILITFERHIVALEAPYVSVEPGTDVAFFDDGDKLEFVCSGSKPIDDRALTWYLQTPVYQVVPPDQNFCNSKNQKCLALHLNAFDHGKLLYCAQDFQSRLSDRAVTSFGELARSRMVTLLHRDQCKKKDQPRVIPEKIVDEHKPFIQLSCYAFLESGQLLSWYQSKGLHQSVDSLLRMIQLQDPKRGEWAVLTLNKTLEPTDNGSEIYCARQSVRLDGSISENKSERIPLTFQRDILPLDSPFISVEPNTTTVYFDPNTTVRLTCSGSQPIDGRSYTWFINDSESGLTVPKDQFYDAATNLNILDLPVNEYYQIELFCVQGFFTFVQHTDLLRVEIYGKQAVSNTITLIQREEQGTSQLIPIVAMPLVLLVLVAAAAACWLRRRRARPAPPAPTPGAPADGNNDSHGEYVNVSRRMTSPQVTYAVLELPNNAPDAARTPAAPQPALYAEIAGVINS